MLGLPRLGDASNALFATCHVLYGFLWWGKLQLLWFFLSVKCRGPWALGVDTALVCILKAPSLSSRLDFP